MGLFTTWVKSRIETYKKQRELSLRNKVTAFIFLQRGLGAKKPDII